MTSEEEIKMPGSPLQIYLLAGQSNMAGRGAVEEVDRQPDPRIFVLDRNDHWKLQGEPIHFDKDIAGVGLGFTFAKLAADASPGTSIGLVPCAVGGTEIARWLPGADLYENACRRARLAGRYGKICGILWHQGEGDSEDEGKARTYANRLSKVVIGFRKDLGVQDVPFLTGKLGEFLRGNSRRHCMFSGIVDEEIESLRDLLPFYAVVPSSGLGHCGDELHFNAESIKEFGRRYYRAMRDANESAISCPYKTDFPVL